MMVLAKAIAPETKVLSLLVGDFNFTVAARDRWCTTTGSWSGAKDKDEAQRFKVGLVEPFRFHDLHHSKWSVNFGVLGCLDRLHGTYCEGEGDEVSAKPVFAKPVLHSTIVIEGEEQS